MTGALTGSAAIVTGGATGIGLGITRRLLRDGADVLVAARDQSEVDTGLTELRSDGFAPDEFTGNLAESGTAEALLDAAVQTYGDVDILVNNAGGGVIRPTLEHTEATLQATIENNLWTTVRSTLALLPHMVERGHGRIINIGAESVRNGLIDHAIYNAAKGGVHALTTGLAREFAEHGITVNTVSPSYVRTPELAAAQEDGTLPARLAHVIERAVELIPVRRPGTVDDVAGAVAYLAGPEADFITGQVLNVNGASSMG